MFPAPFLMRHQDGVTSTRLLASREETENFPNQTDVGVYFWWRRGQFAVRFAVPVGVFSSRRSWKRILTCDCHMSVCVSPPVHHRHVSEAAPHAGRRSGCRKKGAGFGKRRAHRLAAAAGRLMWNTTWGGRWQLPQEVGRWSRMSGWLVETERGRCREV